MVIEAISRRRHRDLLAAAAEHVRAVRVLHLYRQRNAWHQTTSLVYEQDRALFTRLDDAKDAAEDWRKQGSHFCIEEMPALAVAGGAGTLVVAHINTRHPFGTWARTRGARERMRGLLAPGVPVRSFLLAFSVPGTGWPVSSSYWDPPGPSDDAVLLTALNEAGSLPPAGTRRLQEWHSVPEGGRYLLGWEDSPGEGYSRAGVRRIAQYFSATHVARTADAAQEAPSREEA